MRSLGEKNLADKFIIRWVRAGGWPSGESLRKLRPPGNTTSLQGLDREVRSWNRNGTRRL